MKTLFDQPDDDMAQDTGPADPRTCVSSQEPASVAVTADPVPLHLDRGVSLAQFPFLPLWTDAYLADCNHLSDAEHGRYFRILIAMWRSPECRIPNDDAWLARHFHRTPEAVASELRPLISEFCQSTGNWIVQKRLLTEWKRCREKVKSASDSAKYRWSNKKEPSERNASRSTTRTIPTEEESASQIPPINPHVEQEVSNGRQNRDPKIDMATYGFDAKDYECCAEHGADPQVTNDAINDWGANAPHGKRHKKDPHAFVRTWLRNNASRQSRSNGTPSGTPPNGHGGGFTATVLRLSGIPGPKLADR